MGPPWSCSSGRRPKSVGIIAVSASALPSAADAQARSRSSTPTGAGCVGLPAAARGRAVANPCPSSGVPHWAPWRLRRWWDDGGGLAAYVPGMRLVRPSIWLTAVGVAVLAVVGSFGAAGGQPERRGLDAVALALLLVGPAALAVRDRWPLGAVAASMAAACVFIGRGHPFGPIFLSIVVALFSAVQARRRIHTWFAAGIGYLAFFVALGLDPRAEDVGWVHWALVAGWLVVVLAVSDVVGVQRDQAAERVRGAEEEHQRRLGEQRLGLAQELHDVLAHNISLINVQASVALHLLDEQPERARPALSAIKGASHESLHELRTALDTLRRGEEAPRAPAPRLADLDELVGGVRASGLDVRVERPGRVPSLPGALELGAYRIVQEALTNVTRHANAGTVTVRVAYEDGVTVEVIDDGVGGTAPVGNGILGCASALLRSVEPSTRDLGSVAAFASSRTCRCHRDLGRHRRRPGPRTGRLPGAARRAAGHHRRRRGGRW